MAAAVPATADPAAQGPTHRRFLLTHQRRTQGYREWLMPRAEETSKPDLPTSKATPETGDPSGEAVSLTMLWIPPGRFWMGSPEKEPEHHASEGPQHLVQLQGFFMAQTPITLAQWRLVAQWPSSGRASGGQGSLDPDPSRFKGDQRPVENVRWHDAMEFCWRLSQRTGRHYTLPSEAQWEYACRAGTTTPFHIGDTITTELANYDGNFIYGDGKKGEVRQQTTDVASFPANAWGLHDMHGNVWEWCVDPWHKDYQGAPEDGCPWLDEKPAHNADRLLRGGSWHSLPRNCRSAFRSKNHPGDRGNNIGFRVCCLPQDSASLHLST
jgi:formylglycine-generating enzyme required for sulfatase activity